MVHGISPPRLDLLLSESYELLHRAYQGITNNEKKITETFETAMKEFETLKLDATVPESVRALAEKTVNQARDAYEQLLRSLGAQMPAADRINLLLAF